MPLVVHSNCVRICESGNYAKCEYLKKENDTFCNYRF